MFQSSKLITLTVLLLQFSFLSYARAQKPEKLPNLQCRITGEIVGSGFASPITKPVPETVISVQFKDDQIDVSGASPFSLYGKYLIKGEKIYARYVDSINGGNYDRIIEINRGNGSVMIHTENEKDEKKLIGDARGFCEKVVGRKF